MTAQVCVDSNIRNHSQESDVEWPPEAVEAFWLVLKHCMDLRTCKLLEQQLRFVIVDGKLIMTLPQTGKEVAQNDF